MEVAGHVFPSGKNYLYIKTEHGPVFVRNILIITKTNDPRTIAVVREWGAKTEKGVYEPPKGQMEYREIETNKPTPAQLTNYMKKAVLREILEETKLHTSDFKNLRKLPIIYKQEWTKSGIKNAQFAYQYWTASVSDAALERAQKELDMLKSKHDWVEMLPTDVSEKDKIMWWNPSKGWDKIRSSFSKKMTQGYYDYLESYGVRNN